MTTSAWGLLALFLTVLLVAAWPLGIWLARLSSGKLPVWMHRVEAPLYRLAGTSPDQSMNWKQYALSLLAFSALGVLAVYALQRLQAGLPLNPAGMTAVSPDSAFNTAVSFVTNTNWQGYAGESTMSYLTQMLALAVQNFLSAATGIAVVFALIRGFAARSTGVIGNFWVDVTRITTWLLVPLSLVFAVFLVGQGVIQNFDAYKDVTTIEVTSYQSPKNGPDGQPLKDEKGNPVMEDMKAATQTLAMGPVASQEAIKMLGTNGGGFFNANSAHPYENPTALSNFLQMLAIFLIPAALCFAFGREVGDLRQGWAVLAAMTVMFVIAVVAITPAEQAGNPLLTPMGVDQTLSSLQSGGNMEGKEVRYGINASSLFAVITTAASCGAVIAMHDSFTPLGGMVPMVMMQLGEVVFGGVGSGLYGMLIFAILAVFIAGLMIGRTPEYLGKKIEPYEMKMAVLVCLATPVAILVGSGIAALLPGTLANLTNSGAHGFSELLYTYSSAGGNNGSAFAGFAADNGFTNLSLGFIMLFARFVPMAAILAIAGSLAAKKRIAVTEGTLRTDNAMFIGLLLAVVLLVGALSFFPALALGPVAEFLQAGA